MRAMGRDERRGKKRQRLLIKMIRYTGGKKEERSANFPACVTNKESVWCFGERNPFATKERRRREEKNASL